MSDNVRRVLFGFLAFVLVMVDRETAEQNRHDEELARIRSECDHPGVRRK